MARQLCADREVFFGSTGTTQTSVFSGKEKPGGSTPMTVKGRPKARIWLPIALGSPPKRPFQKASPITATLAPPKSYSLGVGSRPSAASTPMTLKNSPEMIAMPANSAEFPTITELPSPLLM